MKAASMKIISVQSGLWEMGKANAVASAMLNEHPEIKAILCANDTWRWGRWPRSRQPARLARF